MQRLGGGGSQQQRDSSLETIDRELMEYRRRRSNEGGRSNSRGKCNGYMDCGKTFCSCMGAIATVAGAAGE